MKYIYCFLFIVNAMATYAQGDTGHKTYVGVEFGFEQGLKGYPGIKFRTNDNDNNISVGGGLGIGITGGRMLTERFLFKMSIYGQLSPQGTIMAKHDTVAKFSKLNLNPSLRYAVFVKKNNASFTRVKAYVGAGALVVLTANMKEKSSNAEYSSVVQYKPALGPTIEAGVEIFLNHSLSIDTGLRFHYITYSAKSYSENKKTVSLDQLPSDITIRKLDGSGGGLYCSLKYWLGR